MPLRKLIARHLFRDLAAFSQPLLIFNLSPSSSIPIPGNSETWLVWRIAEALVQLFMEDYS